MAGLIDTLSLSQQLELIYLGYFNRSADGGGFIFWEGQNSSAQAGGQSAAVALTNIANSFTPQAETVALYPFLSISHPDFTNPVVQAGLNSFINSVYTNLFGHAADSGGLAYWFGQISSGVVGLGKAVLAIANGATGSDATEVLNKVDVALDFTTRTTAAGQGLTNPPAAALLAAAHSVLGGVDNISRDDASVTSAEAATAAFIASGAGGPGTTFALTPGVDVPAIIGNNNTVTGFYHAGSSTTFTPGDNISASATASNNQFTLTDGGTGGTSDPTAVPGTTVANMQTMSVFSFETVNANTAASPAGFTGLKQLNISDVGKFGGGSAITAAGTTNITLVDSALNGNTDSVQGGANINVTVFNTTPGGAILIGSTTAPTGNVTVSETSSGTGFAQGGITVFGSTTTTSVSVTQVLAAATDTDGTVAILDANAASTTKAGSITTAIIDGMGGAAATSAFVSSNALTHLTVNDNASAGSFVTFENDLASPTATALALALNNNQSVTIVDIDGVYTTVNVTTGVAASTAPLSFAGATALTVAGSNVLTMTGSFFPVLTSIAVSGAAGLTDTTDFSGGTSLATVMDTSSGKVTMGLNDTVTSFSGATATGGEVITIAADATKAITGNSTVGAEIVLANTAATFTAAHTGANVTGFGTLGVNSASSGTFVLSGAGATLTGISAIDVQGDAALTTFSKVVAGTSLALDAGLGGAVIYQTSDTLGATDSVAVSVGLAANVAGIATGSGVTLADSVFNGIGTVTINSQGNVSGGAFANTLSTLTDSGMTSLTINGAAGLTIGTLVDNSAASVTITDNDTGAVTIGWTDNSLSSLTLIGNTSLGFADSLTTGITIAGVGDNAAVAVSLVTGAAAGKTDSITLGNGSDAVTDGGVGTINVTLGNGVNVVHLTGVSTDNVTVGTGSNTIFTAGGSTASESFGVHTVTTFDGASVGASGTSLTKIVTLSGLNNTATGSDAIQFAGDASTLVWTGVAATPASAQVTGAMATSDIHGTHDATLLSNWIVAATDTVANGGVGTAAHGVAWFNFQGNTYLVETVAGTDAGVIAAGDTVVKIVGTTTFATAGDVGAGGVFHLNG